MSLKKTIVDRYFRYWLLATALVAFFVIILGNAVRVTDATMACPDWPTCYGQFGIPDDDLARLHFIHRALSGVLAILTVSAGAAAARFFHHNRAISLPIYLAVVVTMVEIGVGAGMVMDRLALFAPLHLGLGLVQFALLLTAMMAAFLGRIDREGSPKEAGWKSWSSFTRLTWAALALAFALLVSGAWIVSRGGGGACGGWPLCDGIIPQSWQAWLEMGHRLITAAAAVVVFAQFLRAWKSQRSQPVQLSAATAVFILLIGQVVIGAMKVVQGFPADLLGLHAASAAGLWGVQVILTAAAVITGRTTEEEGLEAAQPMPFRSRLNDFIALNKPVIVILLLVTTYAGMVVAGKQWPAAGLTFWTIISGALAAGGSSALNQYIDRRIDGSMQRTSQRPIPSGRMQPAEGLAYGLGAVLLSFFLLASFVNLLAALLSLAGAVYYVLIYSIWLKNLTVQNIVIGGGAGAIPPLVGWAAVTGSLSIPAMFLFAIVFMWTPPHFWALALVRKNDYARASVPMLPVVKGEQAARSQIFIYTLELVGLTLLMPIFNLAGSFFLVSAIALGGWLIYAAWLVYKKGGNKRAWKMYRYSSMYLGFLFLALVIDALI